MATLREPDRDEIDLIERDLEKMSQVQRNIQ